MAAKSQHVRRGSLWLGLVICLVGALSNIFYFLNPPVQAALPWINLLVPIAGLAIVIFGLWRAYARPQDYGGKVLGPVFAIVCLFWRADRHLVFSTRATYRHRRERHKWASKRPTSCL
jgi:hypothetical protein